MKITNSFCIWQLVYAPFMHDMFHLCSITNFTGGIIIHNFWFTITKHYHNRQLLYDLLPLITLICTVANKLFRSYYSNSQLWYALLDITTFGFIVANIKLYATVAFATFLAAIAALQVAMRQSLTSWIQAIMLSLGYCIFFLFATVKPKVVISNSAYKSCELE